MSLNRDNIIKSRDIWLKKIHGIEFYDYQKEVSDAIIDSVFFGKYDEMFVEFSRQSGKTTTIVHTLSFIIYVYRFLLNKPLRAGVFAPQKEQAKTDFDRLKDTFAQMKQSDIDIDFSEANATTLKPKTPVDSDGIEMGALKMATISLGGNNEIYAFPISKTSHPESKTLDLIIIEEAQDVDDHNMKVRVFPMGASTDAPVIFIGTAGFHKCYFHDGLKKGKNVYLNDYKKVIESREKLSKETGDPSHRSYKRYVEKQKEKLGEESDEFRSQYKLEWILGTGQFITDEQFNKLVSDYQRAYRNSSMQAFVGIDTAKDPDSTVVTILGYDGSEKKILNWLELKGDNYQDQFDIIWDFMQNYNPKAVAIDSTGQGDFMPDMFERHTYFTNEPSGLYRVKFSLATKDVMYKNLATQIREFLTKVPKICTKEAEKFKEQLLDLQKEYKGNFLVCHHPDDLNAHDDYADSWALAEYAFYKYFEKQPNLTIIEPKEKKEPKKKKERIENYWPGEDIWES